MGWECFNEIWCEDRADRLLGPWGGIINNRADFVVDAIDNIDSKVALLKYCHQNEIRVVSSMGAGCKSDPTRVFIGDVSASLEDPLSRVMRRRLRIEGISEGIPVIYSTEKLGPGKAELLPLPEEEFIKGQVNELSILPDFRARILPVLGTMPAIFGYVAANFVVLEITGYPHELSTVKGREKLYDNVLGNLQTLEERLVRAQGLDSLGLKIPVTKADVAYLLEEVFRGKSVISGLATRPALVRWEAPVTGSSLVEDERWGGQKCSNVRLTDLVCMTKEEAAVHEREVLVGRRPPEEIYGSEALALVARRRAEEEHFSRFR